MLESKIQKKIINELEKDGWYVLNLIKTNKNGIMDLIAVKKNKTMFVEVKKPNGVLSELQKFRIKELKKRGIDCRVWTDYKKDFIYGKD